MKHPFADRSSTDIAQYLARERGVVTLPGAFFSDGQDAYLRFAFANASADDLRKLDKRIGEI